MRVTHVSVRPTEAAFAAGRPALTPELLAASGARYSRNNEGLDAILSKIDPNNLDKSVDSIFRMIDYGHQSIADMAPVAMFLDGLSIWLAYLIWSLCPMAGGQESSTRYIRFDSDALIDPAELGIQEPQATAWRALMDECFAAMRSATELWEELGGRRPELARIPPNLLEDPGDKARKQVIRMQRNYGFDRARYFLPVAASTNVMLVMSARGWVQLCQNLLSHALPEARMAGNAIREELGLSAPRLLRHATEKASFTRGLQEEFEALRRLAEKTVGRLEASSEDPAMPAKASLQVVLPNGVQEQDLKDDLKHHDNRYGWVGPNIRRTAVRFAWDAVALAEIRDLNRHRTGTKYCPLVPLGFYGAMDALAPGDPDAVRLQNALRPLIEVGRKASAIALARLRAGEPDYVYWTLLGTQYYFEHTTTADKFLYEGELRTGTGAHYQYARHLHDALALWYAQFPETKELILEGSGEPE